MKQIPAALQAHYDSGSTSVAHAIVIERMDGELFGFTSHDLPFVLDVTPWGDGSAALVFDAKQGLTASNLVSTSGFAVDNLELTTLDDGSLFQRDEVVAGVWRNASFRIFRYRWDVAAPTIANDVEVLTRGWFGE
ncbi:baseplate hub protein, partial [Comamonas thiooxydans]|uniref:baseplate hub domain-containing protein n=1 Tax=Comamonas thiooxydans TaxID=363952 RepID=UPI00057A73CC